MKYFRQIVLNDGFTEPEEITRDVAISRLEGSYRNPEEVLASSSREHPIRLPFSRIWQHNPKRKE